MIKNLYIKFAFNLTILLTIIFFYNFLHAEEIYFDLSEDSIELKTDPSDRNLVYGTLTVNSLHATDGVVSISPTEIPLWCDAENTAGVGQ